jgi:hypothetical protein
MRTLVKTRGAGPPSAGPPGALAPSEGVVNFMINFFFFENYCGVSHGPEETHGYSAQQ